MCVLVYVRRTSSHISLHTHRDWRLLRGRLKLLLEQSSTNGFSMRTQQVIDEDDVVLWHKRFLLCPGWGLLFAAHVIAWRIDSEQYAISQTVIKTHYSFFTTPIWVLETQWPTLKWCLSLVTVWPLRLSLTLLHFAAPASLSPYVSFESSALIFPLCPSLFQSSLLFSVLFLSNSPSLFPIKPQCLASELCVATLVVSKPQSA